MERVVFLVEKTGARISCLLNPESILTKRVAGVRARQPGDRPLTGTRLTDDPLLFTGGGITELTLDLLFDVSLTGSSIVTENVRELTGQFWMMAESASSERSYGAPPLVRFLWGRHWNFLGIVVAVAERLEYISAEGAPGRSWLRMKLLRTSVSADAVDPDDSLLGPEMPEIDDGEDGAGVGPEDVLVHQLTGEGPDPENDQAVSPTRLDVIAYQYCGFPRWKSIAEFNDIDDPTRVEPGTLLNIPIDWLGGPST
jgi:hypothetical protein